MELERQHEQLSNAVKNTLNNFNVGEEIVLYDEKQCYNKSLYQDADIIKKVKTKYGLEVGQNLRKGARLHSHGGITVVHKGWIRLDYDAIVENVNDQLRIENSDVRIVNWRFKQERVTTEQYMKKYKYV